MGVSNKLITTNTSNLDLGYNNILPLSMDLGVYKNKLDVRSSDSGTSVFINGKWVTFDIFIFFGSPL